MKWTTSRLFSARYTKQLSGQGELRDVSEALGRGIIIAQVLVACNQHLYPTSGAPIGVKHSTVGWILPLQWAWWRAWPLPTTCMHCSRVPSTGAQGLWETFRGAPKPVPKLCKALAGGLSPQSQQWSLRPAETLAYKITYFTLQQIQWQVPSHELSSGFIRSRHLWPPSTGTTHQQQENASMHTAKIRRSGVTCFYQLTKSIFIQPERKVILRYYAIHWQGTAQHRTKAAEGISHIPALLWLQKSLRLLW